MTKTAQWVLSLSVGLGVLGWGGRVRGAEPRPGGFSPAQVTEPEVVEAAKKAVEAQEKILKKEAAVWWQAWRKAEPHMLTGWEWK